MIILLVTLFDGVIYSTLSEVTQAGAFLKVV